MQSRQRIALVRTKATLEEIGSSRLDLVDYHLTGYRVEPGGLVARVPEAREFAETVEHVFVSGAECSSDWPSSLVESSQDLLDLRRHVLALASDDSVDAIVISHGTNTLEETAFFLWATLQPSKPVIVVGSMRPASAISSDVDRNLWAALRVASDPRVPDLGVLVVMNDTIFSARDVTKEHTSQLDSFGAGALGPLGSVGPDGQVVLYHRPLYEPDPELASLLDGSTTLPRVDIVVSYLGADGALIEAAAQLECQGIVVAGRGGGQPTRQEWVAIDRIQEQGIIVCLASRVAAGRVVARPPVPGARLLFAGDLRPWKARLLLMAGLVMTDDVERLQRLFEPW